MQHAFSALRAVALALAVVLTPARAADPTPEDRISAVFLAIEAKQPDVAMKRVDALIRDYPNFRLAHLVRGDLLLARGRPLQKFGNVAKTVPQEKIDDLRDEALVRLRAHFQRPTEDRVPRVVVQLHAQQKHALVVDSRRSRLYVFANANGRPRLIGDYYVTLGKNGVEKTREGDQKTPIGVYHVTANLPRQKLSDFYGSGAFPINYPNEWDKRRGRNGHGIWLHGTPSETYARPPWATDGCVVLTNEDLARLSKYVDITRTPVVIGQAVEWRAPGEWEAEREGFLKAFGKWKSDWESLDTARYLSHYSTQFRSKTRDLSKWSASKRKVNSGKTWVKVSVDDVSLFAYPGAAQLMMITFDQDYRSNNMSKKTHKRQFWAREGNQWRIVHEAVL